MNSEFITNSVVVESGLGLLNENKTKKESGNEEMMKIYVANLGKYNEGELVGEWITLPASEDEMNEMFARIKLGYFDENGEYVHGFIEKDENGYEYHYEEMAVHDYEAPFKISEYSNIEELNEIAERLESLDNDELNVIEAYLENVENDLNRAIEIIENNEYTLYHNCNSMADVAQEWVEMTGLLSEVPENLQCYFDYEAYGRDLEIEGTFIYTGLGVYIEFHN